ncbi:hypothetical protein BH10PLA1_BH10PLA1_07940 [soil metagenome]
MPNLPDAPIQLEYHTAPEFVRVKPAPWVWVVLGVYLLLLLGALAVPTWVVIEEPDSVYVIGGTAVGLIVCGLALMMTPVRLAKSRPLSRKKFLIPLIASGLLFGTLVAAGGLAFIVAVDLNEAPSQWLWAGPVLVWLGWCVVFWIATRSRDPLTVAARFHRWLIGGSVLELLVAVPSHIIVRMRNVCCEDIVTGSAICLGAMVIFIAFGPSVFLLFWRRTRQIRQG